MESPSPVLCATMTSRTRVVVVYHWDEATAAWRAFFPGLEGVPGLNTLTTFTAGGIYWIARR